MADPQTVNIPNLGGASGGDWVVNADGVLEPAVAAPVCLPQGILTTAESVALGATPVNDFAPGGGAILAERDVFVSISAALEGGLEITGMLAPVLTAATAVDKAPIVRLFNAGGGVIVLAHESGLSLAANRFNTLLIMGGGAAPVHVLPGNWADLRYDRGSSRWLVLRPTTREVGVSVQTTDATITEIYNSGPLGQGEVLKLRANIAVARAGGLVGRGGYERQAMFFRDGAAATAQQGAIQTGFTRESPAGLNVSFLINGDESVSVTVDGIAAETFNWRGRVTSDYAA